MEYKNTKRPVTLVIEVYIKLTAMKKLGTLALVLSLTLGTASTATFAKEREENRVVVTEKKSAEVLMKRLHAIRDLASAGNLSARERADLRKEVLDIRKQVKQNDPTLVISLSAALLVALILVILAKSGDDD
jgi:hypothetical protein